MQIAYSPQRSDRKLAYSFPQPDVIEATLDGVTDRFDFSGLPDGELDVSALETTLDICPVLAARRENGLQVCWRQQIVGTVEDFPNTFNNLDDHPFPAVFAELAGIQATVGVTSGSASVRGAFYIASVGAELDRWARLCIVRHANASGAGQLVHVNLLAIGRWK